MTDNPAVQPRRRPARHRDHRHERHRHLRGHLAQDLAQRTTPEFAFITPNLCNDGHDATCAGPNTEGATTGGLIAADLWLKHWMPLILNSPAYRSGSTLVVITFDEGAVTDPPPADHEQPGRTTPTPATARCSTRRLPPTAVYLLRPARRQPHSDTEPADRTMPGGGQIGAVLLNPR